MKLGVIGCGSWGINHVKTLSELSNLVELGLVYDPDSERLSVAKAIADVPVTKKFSDVLNSNCDGFIIASPASTHCSMINNLSMQFHLLVEKPMALKYRIAQKIVRNQPKDKILMVGHLMEHYDLVRQIRQLVNSNDLGQVMSIKTTRKNWGKMRYEENVWWSFAPHDIAFIIGLLGKPKSIIATGSSSLGANYDSVHATLDFGHIGRIPVQATIDVSWLHPHKIQESVVIGKDKTIIFNNVADQLTIVDNKIRWLDYDFDKPVLVKGNSHKSIKGERDFL